MSWLHMYLLNEEEDAEANANAPDNAGSGED